MFDIRGLIPSSLRQILRTIRANFNIRSRGYFIYFNQAVYAPANSVVLKRTLSERVFEADIVNAMIAFSQPKTFVIDVGANIGVMSIALMAARPETNCISIECSPSTLPYLRKTHSSSIWNNRWALVEAAVTDKDGTTNFYTAGADRGAFDGLVDTGRGGPVKQVQVNAKTLDTIWRESGSPNVSLIKIDIEGGEAGAIGGSTELIAHCRPVLIFEWNSENLTANGISFDKIFYLGLSEYEIFALPTLVHVKPHTLRGHMQQTEMFAAIPKSTTIEPNRPT